MAQDEVAAVTNDPTDRFSHPTKTMEVINAWALPEKIREWDFAARTTSTTSSNHAHILFLAQAIKTALGSLMPSLLFRSNSFLVGFIISLVFHLPGILVGISPGFDLARISLAPSSFVGEPFGSSFARDVCRR